MNRRLNVRLLARVGIILLVLGVAIVVRTALPTTPAVTRTWSLTDVLAALERASEIEAVVLLGSTAHAPHVLVASHHLPFRELLPPVLATAGLLPVLAARAVATHHHSATAAAANVAVVLLIIPVAVGAWLHTRGQVTAAAGVRREGA